MKIPFIQHTGIGIHITEKAIRWVELSRIGNRITVERSDFCEITSRNLNECLEELRNRSRPDHPYVSVTIPEPEFIRVIRDVPFVENDTELQSWQDNITQELLPAGVHREDYVISAQILGDQEEGRQCLFILAKSDVVQRWVDLFESVKLQPLIITTGDLEAGYAIMFDEQFSIGNRYLLKAFEDGTILLQYKEGLSHRIRSLDSSVVQLDTALAEVETLVTSRAGFVHENQKEIWVVKSRYNKGKSFDSTESESSVNYIHLIKSPLSGLKNDGDNPDLSPDYAVACGLAVKQLYPELDEINLLDSKTFQFNKESIERKDFMRTALILGGFIGVLLVISFLLQWHFTGKSDDIDLEVSLIQDKITSVKEAREQVLQLERWLMEAKQHLRERYPVARLLELTGKYIPEKVWLNGVTLNDLNEEAGQFELVIDGYAENEAFVAVMMERFEQENGSVDVKLIMSEQVMAGDIYSFMDKSDKQLTEFRLMATFVFISNNEN